jgi:hypothetical protein
MSKRINFSDMGHAEYAAALGPSPHALCIWRVIAARKSGDAMTGDRCFIRVSGINQAALAIARSATPA